MGLKLRANLFPGEDANFGQAMYRSHERSLQAPGINLICTEPRLHLFGRALIWPCRFGALTFGFFGLCPSSLSKSVRFVSLAGKASLVSISDPIPFLRP